MRFSICSLTRAAVILLSVSIRTALPAPDVTEPIRLVVHFDQPDGTLRALHGVNKGPQAQGGLVDLSSQYRELGIPFVRLHDCQWPYPDVVDIHAIFRNPEADPEDPRSYDFALTDDYLAAVQRTGAKVIYRLGESIEHGRVKRFVHPPKDLEHWAAVCRGIVRHYNEGWAGGFHYGITYFEIWNEPENRPAMWSGTDEDFLKLYSVAARSLKAAYPNLKIGGPAFGYSGKLVNGTFEASDFVRRFLEHCRAEKAPVDFFSWHCYTADATELVARAKGVRALLDRVGFSSSESHLNEWNYLPDNSWSAFSKTATAASRRAFFQRSSGMEGATFLVTALTLLQDAPLDVACLFHGELGLFGLFDEFGGETRGFEAVRLFHRFLENGRSRVRVEGTLGAGWAVVAGRGERVASVLMTNSRTTEQPIQVQLRGLKGNGEPAPALTTLQESGVSSNKVQGAELFLRLAPHSVLLLEVDR